MRVRQFRWFQERDDDPGAHGAPGLGSGRAGEPTGSPAPDGRQTSRGARLVFSVVALLLLTVVIAGAHVFRPTRGAAASSVTLVHALPLARSLTTSTPNTSIPNESWATARLLAYGGMISSEAVPSMWGGAPTVVVPAALVESSATSLNTSTGSGFNRPLQFRAAIFPQYALSPSTPTSSTASSTSNTLSSTSTKASGQITTASAVPIQVASTAPAITASHPRLILDAATLSALRQRASQNTSQWQRLKATCDSYIGGTVNYPNQNAYPNLPDLGSGYQGESYLPALLAEGMCYQVLKTSDPSAAATYGAKAVDILMKMAAPSSGQGENPCTDSGYVIRFYGVGYGLGYDWLYDLMTTSQRQQVYTTANAWLTAWEQPGGCAAFEYNHPQSNYYAGYFHAKAVIALATYGDNPSAPAEWDDWYNNQFLQRVQPYYAQHLSGGGWPEGYGNYASLAILNMDFPAREVKTATGVDIVHAPAPYSFPLDNADYAMHFTWPSRSYFDDRDTNHATGSSQQPGTNHVSLFVELLGTLEYWGSSETSVFREYLNEVRTATSDFDEAAPWLQFLDEAPSGSTSSVFSLPLSYYAKGMGMVSARSNWGTTASWMSFRAGPYTNNPDQGEEGFDEGSLALVHGGVPMLVNAYGWMVHDPGGSADENRLYNDEYGSFDGTQYMGNREMYNIFYVRNMSGSSIVERFGQGAYTTESDNVRTAVSGYEDGKGYVYALGTHLEDMYRSFSAGAAVSSWSRQIVFLRPDIFVVYDRTTAGSSSYDQYMAWHFPANPVSGTAATGENRLDVTYSGAYVGAMTTVFPTGATLKTVGLYPSSSPVKVWQVQERPSSTTASQNWVTVFDLADSASQVASSSSVNITAGNMLGVRVSGPSGTEVLISSTGAAGTPVSGTVAYQIPSSPAYHVITDLQSSTSYSVSVAVSGGNQTITVAPSGSFNSSANGVLSFYVAADGSVSVQAPGYSRLPISTLPVDGYPTPYN